MRVYAAALTTSHRMTSPASSRAAWIARTRTAIRMLDMGPPTGLALQLPLGSDS